MYLHVHMYIWLILKLTFKSIFIIKRREFFSQPLYQGHSKRFFYADENIALILARAAVKINLTLKN